MNKNIKGFLFLLNVLFIFFTELIRYSLNRNYSFFIDTLCLRLSSINILYVKIFQAFALNNNLIDEETNNKLLKFTDNAPWTYSDINLEKLIEVTNDYNILMNSGYEIPVNSGMISLVFKGYMDSKPVIIKIKRKNIEKKLNDAIDNSLFFIYILSFIPLIHKYQLPDVICKNIEIIRHQTNNCVS